MNNNVTSSKPEGIVNINDVKSLWKIVRKNWYIIIICLAFAYAFSSIYVYKLSEIYEAQTQILLKSRDTRYADQISQGIAGYWWYDANQYSDELKIVKSFDLVEKAVEKLKLDVSYYIVGRLKTAEVYEFIPFEVEVISIKPSLYELPIYVKFIDQYTCELTYDKGDGAITKKTFFDTEIVDNDFNIIIKKKSNVIGSFVKNMSVVQYMIRIHDKQSLVYKYQAAISAEIPEKTAILKLSVTDEVPQRAVAFLDTISKIYINNSLSYKYELNNKTLEYIEKQLSEVVAVLQVIEDDLENYKESRSILDLPKEEEEDFTQLTNNEKAKVELNMQLSSIEALEKYIIEDKDPELLPPAFYVNNTDEFLKKSVAELYSMQIQINGALFNSTEKSYSINEINLKIKKLKENILIYINNTKAAINSNIDRINSEISMKEL